MIYSFSAYDKNIIHSNRAEVVVQFQQTPVDRVNGYSNLSWTGSQIDADRVVIAPPVITREGGDEGQIFSTISTIECSNREFYTGYRMSDVLTYDPYLTLLHCRVGYRRSSAEAYTWFGGLVDHNSIKVKNGNPTDLDRWIYSFDVADYLTLLQDVTLTAFLDASMQHVDYDVSASVVYATYMHSSPNAPIGAGKVYIDSIWAYDGEGNNDIAYTFKSNQMRFFPLTSMFQAVSNYLGMDTTINNNQNWNAMVSTKYMFNKADFTGVDDFVITQGGIDDLYVMSCWERTTPYHEYVQTWGLFDHKKNGNISLHNKGDVLEAVRLYCTSLGLEISTRFNTSGQRYLQVQEQGRGLDTISGSVLDSAKIGGDWSYDIYGDTTAGIQVNGPYGTSYVQGNISKDYLNIDCVFTVGTNLARRFIHYTAGTRDTATYGNGQILHSPTSYSASTTAWTVVFDRGDKQLYGQLWVTDDSIFGSNPCRSVSAMYSVCGIIPKRNGHPIPASATGLPNNVTYAGEYRGLFGGLGINGVMVPTTTNSDRWHDFEHVPAYALALYNYSITGYDADPVGFSRRYQKEIVFDYADVLGWYDIGQLMEMTVDGKTIALRLKGMEVDLSNFTTKVTATILDYQI